MRFLTPAAFVALATVLSACPDDAMLETLPFEPADADNAPAPAEFGPFPVGVRTIVIEDPTRLNPEGTADRSLTLEIWYPAAQSAKDQDTVTYVLWEELPASLQADIPEGALGEVATAAVRDADVQPDRDPFPFVVFSHGKGGIRQQSTFHTVLLASHGYVVVSPDHQGDTVVELLLAGDVVISDTLDSAFDRPLDVSLIIDTFEDLDNDDPLAGRIDMDSIGVVGHSMGALTAFRSAGGDARIDAIMGHTPVGITAVNVGLEYTVDQFEIPTAIQAAGLDRTLEPELHADSLWSHMPSPKEYLMLDKAGHFTFSDLCVLDVEALDEALDLDVSNVLTDGCGPENLDVAEAFPAINHFTVGFFNAHLRGSAATLDVMTEADLERIAPGTGSYQFER